MEEQVWENYSPYKRIIECPWTGIAMVEWVSKSGDPRAPWKANFCCADFLFFFFSSPWTTQITTFFSKSVPTRTRPRKYGNRHREWRPMQPVCLGSILGAVPAWPSGSCGRNCNDWFYNPLVNIDNYYLHNHMLSIFNILISCGKSILNPKANSYYIYSLWSENFV